MENKKFIIGASGITCPLCEEEVPDSWDANDSGSMECGTCRKSFSYKRLVETSYDTYEIKE